MREINVKDARREFKAVLDQAAAGEEVVILRHGVPVARVMPPAERRRLPPLGALRGALTVRGRSLGEELVAAREGEERF